jgi:hypothetical protein
LKHKPPWSCRDCGHEWRATVGNRTKSVRPSGCPGKVPTETNNNNLKLTCEESGGRLAHLLEEWNHPTKPMEDFTPASGEKVPWKCGGGCGGEWNARISDRTRSEQPTGCPECNTYFVEKPRRHDRALASDIRP